ncbi:MAG: PAS domain-containing protein [Actinobacteria bacterium]|nr:PAS domain-containing protein [Actinomycetota bacterium]
MKTLDDRLVPLLPLVQGLAELLGEHCEVVLHDLAEMPHTIVAIEHGEVTGRAPGDVPTDLMLRTLRRSAADDAPSFRVYVSTGRGRVLRSLSVPLRTADGETYGLLGVNMDVTDLVQAQRQLWSLTAVAPGQSDEAADTDEIFSGDIREVVDGMIAKILAEQGKSPAQMSREEKMEVVKKLEERGAFLVKRAADQVADGLDLSRYTIFSYLKEIRRQTGDGEEPAVDGRNAAAAIADDDQTPDEPDEDGPGTRR